MLCCESPQTLANGSPASTTFSCLKLDAVISVSKIQFVKKVTALNVLIISNKKQSQAVAQPASVQCVVWSEPAATIVDVVEPPGMTCNLACIAAAQVYRWQNRQKISACIAMLWYHKHTETGRAKAVSKPYPNLATTLAHQPNQSATKCEHSCQSITWEHDVCDGSIELIQASISRYHSKSLSERAFEASTNGLIDKHDAVPSQAQPSML